MQVLSIWEQLDHIQNKVAAKQKTALEGLEKQAERMLRRTEKAYPEVSVGDNVKVSIPHVDRTRVDLANLLAMVVSVNGPLPMYKLGCRYGHLDGFFNRKDFVVIKEKFITSDDVPDTSVELRKAAKEASLFGGQGIIYCNCKSVCMTKSCGCKKKGVLCNSRCHNKNNGCLNK